MNPHWIVKESNCIGVFTWMCSSCGYSYDSLGIARPEDVVFYHCPWCGTRLIDLDKEDEDES